MLVRLLSNFSWFMAFGQAENGSGENIHVARVPRFDKKTVGTGEGEEWGVKLCAPGKKNQIKCI